VTVPAPPAVAPDGDIARKAVAELVGTAFLVATVVGSGIMATDLTQDAGLRLLVNSLVTGAVLVALILTLQPVSAAFNPVVTCVEALFGAITWRAAAVFALAQVVGGCVGAVVANLMFDLDAVSISTRERFGGGVWLGEVVATFGLVLVVFGAIRTARTETVAYSVGGYIAAAYWFTSSTSFANPAVTVARTLSDTFAGIEPASAPMFVAMQALGAGVAALLVRLLFPAARTKPAVLFVCVHNAGRSQMAAGYLEHLAGDRIDVLSAGSKPGAEINPVAVQAMAEEGIDIAGRRPEVLTAGAVQASDVVITMGCGDECPYFPGKRYEDWQLDDPAGQGIDAVRPIRDEIRRRVERLIDELLPA
jgi:arsenate reductase